MLNFKDEEWISVKFNNIVTVKEICIKFDSNLLEERMVSLSSEHLSE